ncbi:MAG: hypothetical protein IJ262_07185 [Clostridia bacterium]|nr:hypothetical protein [Clostridia bacterium]
MKLTEKIKNQNSIKKRYIFSVTIIIIIVTALNVFQFLTLEQLFIYSTKKNMTKAAEEIISLDLEDENFMRTISDIEAEHQFYVEIYKPRDVLVYTTNTNNWIFNSQLNNDTSELKPRIMKILSHRDLDQNSYMEERQEYFANGCYYVFGMIGSNKSIEIYASSETISGNANIASWTIVSVSVLLTLIFMLTVYVFFEAFVKPLNKIIKVTKKMTHTDFSELCPEFAVRELDELSSSVNSLSVTLDRALKDLRAKNEELELDIEKKKRIEETRKYFIANASHELKTPIAIIQGYAEAIMLDVDDCSPEEYCNIIIEETEKMNSLVMRLLEITKYEYGYILKCSNFKIISIVEKYLSSRLQHIKNQGIKISVDIDESFIGYGDFDILADVFDNYMSNAVSHVDNEKEIVVSCKLIDNNYRLSVFNTGFPIESEDLENIWESFYRADKARSRSQGRFGLGLALVASSQNLHNQKYGVVNHENGVEFWFDISGYDIQ